MTSNTMFKIELLDKIEKKMNLHLDNIQIQFLFSDKSSSLYTTPRQYGKDTMICIRTAINAITSPNKRILILSINKPSSVIIKTKILEIIQLLLTDESLPKCNSISKESIRFNNGAEIIFAEAKNYLYAFHGIRLNEVIINEFDLNLKEIHMLARCCCLQNVDGQVFMVGTPINNSYLMECSSSEYIEHVHVLNRHVERLHQLKDLRETMDIEQYRYEILGEIF